MGDSTKQTLENIGNSFLKINSVIVKGEAPFLVLNMTKWCTNSPY